MQRFNGKAAVSGIVITEGLNSTNTADLTYALATITVNVHGGGLATIFSDNVGTPLANPFTANSDATFSFYAANGRYDIVVSGTGVPTNTVADVLLNDSGIVIGANTALAFSATPVFNAALFTSFSMTLTGNVTSSTISGGTVGQIIVISLTQGAGGPWTFAWPASVANPPTLTPTAAKTEQFTFILLADGNWHLVAIGEYPINQIAAVTGTGNTAVLQQSPTITSPTITGTIAGSPTITAPTITSPNITGTITGGAAATFGNIITGNINAGSGSITAGTVAFSGALTAGSLNNICEADRQAGADLGAKINACEAIIGAGVPGEIWIAGGGTMTTTITPSSNHVYRFFPGTYNFPSAFQFVSLTGFKIICEPGCVLNNQQTSYQQGVNAFISPLIYVNSGTHVQHPTLTANGNVGATSVTVTSGTGLAAGQEVQIFDTRFSEVNQIASSYVPGSTTVPLVRPLENNYTTARGAELDLFNWAKNFLIRGVTCTGVNGATGSSGGCVVLDNALDGVVEDLVCFSSAGRCYLAAHSSSRILANGIHAFNPSDNSVENYITSSHNIVQNVWVTNSTANCMAIHGFHETAMNLHLWGCAQKGLQMDTGQFITVSGAVISGNGTGGVQVSGAATPFTTEATDVNLSGFQVVDNLGDGLSACTGGNSKVNITASDFLRNQGSNGNVYLNGCGQGTTIIGGANYGATVGSGMVLDGTMTGLNVNGVNFAPGPNQSANAVNDLRVAATGNISQSQFLALEYSFSATPFLNNGTFSLSSINYQASRGSQPPNFANNGAWNFQGAQLAGTSGFSATEGGATGAVAGTDVCYGDSTAHALKCSYNGGTFFNQTQTIGIGTVTTAGTAVTNGTCQAQTAMTITGATATDTAYCSLNAAAPATWQTGIFLAVPEVTLNTVTVRLCNGTAASITPAAATVRCTVTR